MLCFQVSLSEMDIIGYNHNTSFERFHIQCFDLMILSMVIQTADDDVKSLSVLKHCHRHSISIFNG